MYEQFYPHRNLIKIPTKLTESMFNLKSMINIKFDKCAINSN